jgi:RHS repeat-associated protein
MLTAEYGPVSGSGTSYLTADNLGSTRVVTDPTGSPQKCYDYLPFGEEIPNTIGGRTALTCYSSGAYPRVPDIEAQKFTGKERDAETGLDCFGARYYSGAQGRWTSPDRINLTSKRLLNPSNTLNKYVYAANNPLKYVDSDGEDITLFYRRGLFDTGHIQMTAFNQASGKVASLDFVPNAEKVKVINGTVQGFAVPMRSPQDMLNEGYASLTIRTTPEEAQKVIEWINKFQQNTPSFNLLSSNCTTSCVEALRILGLDVDPDIINPDTLWDAMFPKHSTQPGLPTLGHYPAQEGREYGNPRYPGMTMFGLSDLYYRLWLNQSSKQQEPKGCVTTTDSASGTTSTTCDR